MNGKLVEALRSADQMVQATARDFLTRRPLEEAQDRQYPVPVPAPSGLSEPGAVGLSDAPLSNMLEARHPVVMLAKADHNGLPQADVLEALLYIAGLKADSRQTAEKALRAFGSVGAVLSARLPELIAELGIQDQIAYALKAIHTGIRSVLQEPIRERHMIQSLSQLIDYLRAGLKHEKIESLRLLYLDRKNGLISEEDVSRDTVDHVPLYPRELVKQALQHGASAVIMVHNHPSGDPAPSNVDVTFSRELQRALNVMGIVLHDSLILGRNSYSSLRGLGYL